MSKGVNKVILLGSVGKDPEVRNLPSGIKIANISLATTERYKDRTGKQKEQTEWHNLVAYAQLAGVVEKYVQKGSTLYIEGKLETRSWEDPRSKEKKYQTQIKIDQLVFAGGSQKNSNVPVTSNKANESEDPTEGWDEFL